MSNARHLTAKEFSDYLRLLLNKDTNGLCLGLASQATASFLIGELQAHSERLSLIKSIPLDQFVDQIKCLEKKRQKKLELSSDEMDILNISIFMWNIHINHNPQQYKFLFNYKVDKQLFKCEPHAITMSKKLEQLNGAAFIDLFSGLYNLGEIIKYFKSLEQAIKPYQDKDIYIPPFSIMLMTGLNGHAMMVGYDDNAISEKKWVVSNNTLCRYFNDIYVLSQYVLDNFLSYVEETDNKQVCFSSHVIASNKYCQVVSTIINDWKNMDEWLEIHENHHKINVVDDDIDDEIDIIKNNILTIGNNWLCAAIVNQDYQTAKSLLEAGADCNQMNSSDQKTYYHLIASDDLELFKIFIKMEKANGHPDIINCLREFKNRMGRIVKGSLLNISAMRGAYAISEYLIMEEGAIINPLHENEAFALEDAIKEGHIEIVQLLIRYGANVNFMNEFNQTPLYLAAQNGHEKIIKILLKNNAALDSRLSDNNLTELMIAANNGHENCVKMLIKYGADVHATAYNKTALQFAIKKGEMKIVNRLIDATQNVADIDSIRTEAQKNLNFKLFKAVQANDYDLSQQLINKGAHVNSDAHQEPLLVLAFKKNNTNLIELLVNHGADVNCEIEDSTLLAHVFYKKLLFTTELLIEHGANTEKSLMMVRKNKKIKISAYLSFVKYILALGLPVKVDKELLYLIYIDNDFSAIKLLIESGMNSNTIIYNHTTLLNWAFFENSRDLVDLLIKKGADLNKSLLASLTEYPCDEKKKLELIQFLIVKGANINVRDEFGKSIIQIASQVGALKILAYLSSYKQIIEGNKKEEQSREINEKSGNKRSYSHFSSDLILFKQPVLNEKATAELVNQFDYWKNT